ncbi:hypothetical protein JMJ56_25505 [Belnapia sp. T18]|uniref:Uncharacterized protein n=1 Tax=Belnapia arida TaxID=2804533 RepID=A0ABS1U9J3_9PROT|nr:hypothetical protein [Belnapia arida]MBL6081357.1 hypothetical protein [Belnapia arida]
MPGPRQVGVENYRDHRIEVQDDGAEGWMLTIFEPNTYETSTLRCSVPDGLAVLLDEARSRVDRRLDGQAWHHERH